MRTSKKTLSISLLFLLIPTAVIAWLGLTEIGRLEGQVKIEMTRGLEDELRDAERELASRIRSRVKALSSSLEGQSMMEVLREISEPDIADGTALPGALLFRDTLDELWPVRNTRREVASVTLPPIGLRARYRDLTRRLNESEFLATRGLLEDACEHLVTWEAPKMPIDGNSRLEYERGRLLLATGKYEQAARALKRASRSLDGLNRSTRRRAGLSALDLLVKIKDVEATRRSLEARAGATKEELRDVETRAIALLDSIARGHFDGESDAWLDRMFELVRGKLTIRERNEQLVAEITERRRWHASTRTLQRYVIDRDLARLETTDSDLVLYTILEADRSTLVAFTPMRILLTRSESRVWLGKPVNIEKVAAKIASDVEGRLLEQSRNYSLVVVDASGRDIAPRKASPGQPALTSTIRESTTRRALGGALLGLTLELRPNDVLDLQQATRRGILVKSALLVGLVLLAGVGAFLLLRTVRRESELAELRTEFVGRVSHELKTPLALIHMYGETLALGRVRDPVKTIEFARVIKKEAGRLTDMIDRVLDFSKIEAGSRSYTPQRTQLDEVVADVVEKYRPHFAEAGFEIRSDLQSEVFADVEVEALRQALVNLLSNARKYGGDVDQADKTIDVTLDADGQEAVLRVSDRGVGIPEGERERVFETFYRASTAGERRGAGLGLALVKHFTEAHGGSCRCLDRVPTEHRFGTGDAASHEASATGPGTSVEIRLPISAPTPGDSSLDSVS